MKVKGQNCHTASYLRVMLDDQLSWREYAKMVHSKMQQGNFALCNHRQNLFNASNKMTIFNVSIRAEVTMSMQISYGY